MPASILRSLFKRTVRRILPERRSGFPQSGRGRGFPGDDATALGAAALPGEVGEVAKAVGYTAAGHFAELFCGAKGILPMEYRKSVRK